MARQKELAARLSSREKCERAPSGSRAGRGHHKIRLKCMIREKEREKQKVGERACLMTWEEKNEGERENEREGKMREKAKYIYVCVYMCSSGAAAAANQTISGFWINLCNEGC